MELISRSRRINQKHFVTSRSKQCVVYWMVRDHRVVDNWALLVAQKRAIELQQPLVVIVTLRKKLLPHHGTKRMLSFMLSGLQEVARECEKLHIGFSVLLGEPVESLSSWSAENDPSCIVTDFSPLRPYTTWVAEFAKDAQIPVIQVDAHNIVPTWIASPKQEWAARTFRPKTHALLAQYLTDFPRLKRHPYPFVNTTPVDWKKVQNSITVDQNVGQVEDVPAGTTAGMRRVKSFIEHGLSNYAAERNDPTKSATSRLSAYLHFGHISAQRVAMMVERSRADERSKVAYLEELIVRRELADNFCFYQSHYNSLLGAPDWAQRTLEKHKKDPLESEYSLETLTVGETHDLSWNAAQLQMVKSGYMHGYMRMYWAKKILEWSPSAGEAIRRAIFLNDRFQLDGRDPNGYVGILWSIAGLHDRPWFERPIFGSVRYMSESGLKKKFDLGKYVEMWTRKSSS